MNTTQEHKEKFKLKKKDVLGIKIKIIIKQNLIVIMIFYNNKITNNINMYNFLYTCGINKFIYYLH